MTMLEKITEKENDIKMEFEMVKKTVKELASMVLNAPRNTMFVFAFEPVVAPGKDWAAVFISNNCSEDRLFYHGDIGLFKSLEDGVSVETVCEQLLEWFDLAEGLKLSEDSDVYVQTRSETKKYLFMD